MARLRVTMDKEDLILEYHQLKQRLIDIKEQVSYYELNKKKIDGYSAKYYQGHTEQRKAYRRQWYRDNKEHVKAISREYYYKRKAQKDG